MGILTLAELRKIAKMCNFKFTDSELKQVYNKMERPNSFDDILNELDWFYSNKDLLRVS